MSHGIDDADLAHIRIVLEALADRDFERIRTLPNTTPNDDEEFLTSIDQYGINFVHPPPEFAEKLDVHWFRDGRGCWIEVPLWADFGESDVTLDLELRTNVSPHHLFVCRYYQH